MASEWLGQVTCRAICPRLAVTFHCILIHMITVRNNLMSKKNNVNTFWGMKFKLIFNLKQSSRSNSDIFRAKCAVPLCPLCSPTQPPFCVFPFMLYGDRYIDFPFFSFLSCLYKQNGGVPCDLAFSLLTMS